MLRNRSNRAAAIISLHRGVLPVWLLFFLIGGCMGQETCGAEVKVLLDPHDPRASAHAFDAGQPSMGRVFLYDTETRDLLAHGIILRVRQGVNSDVTVKLRLQAKKAIKVNSGDQVRFKCELDYAGGKAAYSYSERTKLKGDVPETGADLFGRLNEPQLQLLGQSDYVIDWKKVKRVADIRSTAWPITSQRPFDELDLELWEWPGGSVLEVSTKADPASLQTTYDQMRNITAGKGLALNSTQQFKTEMVLTKSP